MSEPQKVVVKIAPQMKTVKVVRRGDQGIKGDTGDPGIIVSATAPADPQENDLWVDIST